MDSVVLIGKIDYAIIAGSERFASEILYQRCS